MKPLIVTLGFVVGACLRHARTHPPRTRAHCMCRGWVGGDVPSPLAFHGVRGVSRKPGWVGLANQPLPPCPLPPWLSPCLSPTDHVGIVEGCETTFSPL